MRIKHVEVSAFKNLRDLSLDLDEESPTSVLVGRNGSGKSNLLEALTVIFRDLDLGNRPAFPYRLTYECRGHEVKVDADPERKTKRITVTVDGRSIRAGDLATSEGRNYLPNYVFGYYSGPGDRMEGHFLAHQGAIL
jgi:recombinational DNA repair ATPase RecF